MAKKKTNSLFENIELNNTVDESNLSAKSSLSATVDSIAADADCSDDLVQNLKNEISKLNVENATLTEKLAAYIENKPTDFMDSRAVSAELEKLRYEKNELQIENDSYLMKISELSFENAKLTSQLQQLQSLSKDTSTLPQPTYCENAASKQNVVFANSNYVPYNRHNGNGYNSWN